MSMTLMGAQAPKAGSINRAKHRLKPYTAPRLNKIGDLHTLILGQSGLGVDSVSRRLT